MSYHKRNAVCKILKHTKTKLLVQVGKNDIAFNIPDLRAIGYDVADKNYLKLYIPSYKCTDAAHILNTTHYCNNLNTLMSCYNSKKLVSGKILYKLPGGYVIKLLNLFQAFLPLSQTGQADLSEVIGDELNFQIINLNLRLNSIIVRYRMSFSTFADIYSVGSPVDCTIKLYNPNYGLFVQVKTFDAFIHNFSLPEKFPKIGTMKAYIAHIDRVKKRIYLTLNPMSKLEAGTQLSMTIVKILNGGLIGELEDKTRAFIPSREISWLNNSSHNYKIGNKISAILVNQTYIYNCSIRKGKINIQKIKSGEVYKVNFLGARSMAVKCGDIKIDLQITKDEKINSAIGKYLGRVNDREIDVILTQTGKKTSAEFILNDEIPTRDEIKEAESVSEFEKDSEYDRVFKIRDWTMKYNVEHDQGYIMEYLEINPYDKIIILKQAFKEATISDLL